MSGMVFCHGCGAEVHATAPKCPKCGAPQQLDRTKRYSYGFGNSIALCFNRYVQFSGRSPRAEFWYFTLFTVLISAGAGVLEAIWLKDRQLFSSIVNLAFFLPSLSVSIRRLHDHGRSGWWYWLVVIPVVGWLILFIWMVSRGTRGANRFGPDPLTI